MVIKRKLSGRWTGSRQKCSQFDCGVPANFSHKKDWEERTVDWCNRRSIVQKCEQTQDSPQDSHPWHANRITETSTKFQFLLRFRMWPKMAFSKQIVNVNAQFGASNVGKLSARNWLSMAAYFCSQIISTLLTESDQLPRPTQRSFNGVLSPRIIFERQPNSRSPLQSHWAAIPHGDDR